MRLKRKKCFRKTLQFYRVNFGICAPYRVLLDGTFIQMARKLKLLIREQLPRTLLGPATPVISSCTMDELRSFRHELIETVVIAKHFYRHKCGHNEDKNQFSHILGDYLEGKPIASATGTPVSGVSDGNTLPSEQTCSDNPLKSAKACTPSSSVGARECIIDLIGQTNPHHYIVATQDPALKAALRAIPGVPLLSIAGPGIILEPPTKASVTEHYKIEDKKRSASSWEKQHLPSLSEVNEPVKPKRKRKGKHPLSCLPKSKPVEPLPTVAKAKRRRKRSRHASSACEEVTSHSSKKTKSE